MKSDGSCAQRRDEKRALIDRMLESAPSSATAFQALLTDEDWVVRQWTIEAIMKLQPHDAAPLIADRIDDPDSMVRIEAIEAIGLLRYGPASTRLRERLTHDVDSLVRLCAAEALGDLGEQREEVTSSLVAALEHDRNALVRAYAADSLGRLGTAAAKPNIKAQLEVERSTRARASMLLALYRLGDDHALRALLDMLRRVRRLEMEAVILTMLREIVSPENRDELAAALRRIADAKPRFAEDHPLDMELLRADQRG